MEAYQAIILCIAAVMGVIDISAILHYTRLAKTGEAKIAVKPMLVMAVFVTVYTQILIYHEYVRWGGGDTEVGCYMILAHYLVPSCYGAPSLLLFWQYIAMHDTNLRRRAPYLCSSAWQLKVITILSTIHVAVAAVGHIIIPVNTDDCLVSDLPYVMTLTLACYVAPAVMAIYIIRSRKLKDVYHISSAILNVCANWAILAGAFSIYNNIAISNEGFREWQWRWLPGIWILIFVSRATMYQQLGLVRLVGQKLCSSVDSTSRRESAIRRGLSSVKEFQDKYPLARMLSTSEGIRVLHKVASQCLCAELIEFLVDYSVYMEAWNHFDRLQERKEELGGPSGPSDGVPTLDSAPKRKIIASVGDFHPMSSISLDPPDSFKLKDRASDHSLGTSGETRPITPVIHDVIEEVDETAVPRRIGGPAPGPLSRSPALMTRGLTREGMVHHVSRHAGADSGTAALWARADKRLPPLSDGLDSLPLVTEVDEKMELAPYTNPAADDSEPKSGHEPESAAEAKDDLMTLMSVTHSESRSHSKVASPQEGHRTLDGSKALEELVEPEPLRGVDAEGERAGVSRKASERKPEVDLVTVTDAATNQVVSVLCKLATRLYRTYVESGSPMQVNVLRRMVDEVKGALTRELPFVKYSPRRAYKNYARALKKSYNRDPYSVPPSDAISIGGGFTPKPRGSVAASIHSMESDRQSRSRVFGLPFRRSITPLEEDDSVIMGLTVEQGMDREVLGVPKNLTKAFPMFELRKPSSKTAVGFQIWDAAATSSLTMSQRMSTMLITPRPSSVRLFDPTIRHAFHSVHDEVIKLVQATIYNTFISQVLSGELELEELDRELQGQSSVNVAIHDCLSHYGLASDLVPPPDPSVASDASHSRRGSASKVHPLELVTTD